MRTTLCVALLLLSGPSVHADEARQVFDSLYAQKIKAVAATVDKGDDIALAKDLVAVGKGSGDTPALAALLYRSSIELGMTHADGLSTAIEAARLLAALGAHQADAQEKLIDLLTRQSRTGKAEEREAAAGELVGMHVAAGDRLMESQNWMEAIASYRRATAAAGNRKSIAIDAAKAKLDEAIRRERLQKQVALLQERVLKNANDSVAAEELVRLCIAELDRPADAAKYLDRVKDPAMKELVPLLLLPADQVKPADHLRVGEWLNTWGLSQRGAPGIVLLRRADSHLARHQADPEANTLSKRKTELLRADLAKAIDRLQRDLPAVAAPGDDEPTLTVISARYGIGTEWTDVTDALNKRIKNGYLIALLQPNYMTGIDPKPGARKVVEIKYKIGDKTAQVAAAESGVVALAAPRSTGAGTGLTIIAAQYGAVVSWVDIADTLTKQIKDNKLKVAVNVGLNGGTDPAFGERKMAYIIYSWRGKQYAVYAADGETIQLPPK